MELRPFTVGESRNIFPIKRSFMFSLSPGVMDVRQVGYNKETGEGSVYRLTALRAGRALVERMGPDGAETIEITIE